MRNIIHYSFATICWLVKGIFYIFRKTSSWKIRFYHIYEAFQNDCKYCIVALSYGHSCTLSARKTLSKECTFLDDKIKKVDLVSIKCGFIEKWTIQAIIKNKINGLCWFFYDSCVSIIFMLGRVKNKCTRSKQTNYFINKEIPQIN